jgi:RNA polymerase sigma-70 factor (ECF subfamily)
MTTGTHEPSELLRRAGAGDPQALDELLAPHRDRLRRMVRLRLHRSLQGRVDPADVLALAYRAVGQGLADYQRTPALPFYLWLRQVTGQQLIAVHQQHLGPRTGDPDVSLYRGALPQANSVSLAAQLLGRQTSPSQAAVRAETQIKIQEALNGLAPLDREVLALRHFEMLNNDETAQVLGITKSAASRRYLGALKQLKDVLSAIPGFLDGP